MGNAILGGASHGSIDPASIELPPTRTLDISAWLWADQPTSPNQ